jgi:hypothetical protein
MMGGAAARAVVSGVAASRRGAVLGPPYTFVAGSMPEAKRLAAAGRIGVPPLDAGCHDISPLVLPHLHRWLGQYGKNPFVLCSSLHVTYYGFRGDLKDLKFLQINSSPFIFNFSLKLYSCTLLLGLSECLDRSSYPCLR